MKIIEKVKETIRGWFGSSSNEEVREPTLIEKRSPCPLCIAGVDKIDDSENKAPSKEIRYSGRDDL